MTSEPKVDAGETPAAVTELEVTGMSCGNCARHVTEAIQGVPGVRSATVRLESQTASVDWRAGTQPDPAKVIRAVEEAGYGAEVRDCHAGEEADRKLAGWRFNLWIGVVGTLALMLGEWVFGLGASNWFGWFSLLVAGVVQVFAGASFYRGAWNQLRIRSANMDTLVALGSSTAFVYSTWALLSGAGGHFYFTEAAAILTVVSLGHWFEARASARASDALRSLLHLAPERARRLRPEGEVEVPVSELRRADRIALRPGDRVPTDARVIEGGSAVDESMLTGESAPVEKAPESLIYAGTLNLNGRLVAQVTSTGEETALSRVIDAVRRAQTSRAKIQRIADRVSNVFVPAVVLAAVGSALWWGLAPESAKQVHERIAPYLWHGTIPLGTPAVPFIIAAAVLIIACPCAMGLATPAAIMAGTNAAARRGILIRDGVALEKAGNLTAVLFDKTGTLTRGKPCVAAIWDGGKVHDLKAEVSQPSFSMRLAGAVARHSQHPVSQALAQLSSDGPEVSCWKEIAGAGVQAMGPNQKLIRIGSLRWLKESGAIPDGAEEFIRRWSETGATLVGMSADRSFEAAFAVEDPIKPGASGVVAQLRRQGLRTYLITGDNSLTAISIAKQAGISPENVFAEVRPEQKAELVRKLQAEGAHVAFVGDGINDAPALEQADLGIAVSRASDIAREAADMILLKSEIETVPESLGLARATLRTIKQNLFWAFFYNAVGVPLAAMGFMSPILCAAAMGFSDLIVIGNALRLRHWHQRRGGK